MAINDLLETGRQGLNTQRTAMQTASGNIANANTPGYTRRVAQIESTGKNSIYDSQLITPGCEVTQINRVHDPFIQNQIVEQAKYFGKAKTQTEKLQHLEKIVTNEIFRPADLINQFFNAARELSANPESSALRESLLQTTEQTISGFKQLSNSLEEMKFDIDQKLETTIHEVNSKLKELANLNQKISHFSRVLTPPHDLLDQREKVIRELSQKLGYQISTDQVGNMNLAAGGLGVLVNGDEYNELTVMRTGAHDKKTAGSLDICLKDPFGLKIVTGSIKEGEIAGMIHVRDNTINATLKNLDQVVFQFSNKINEVHQKSYSSDGSIGNSLFINNDTVDGVTNRIAIKPEIKGNPRKIGVGLESGSPGDNRAILEMVKIQDEKMLPEHPSLDFNQGPFLTMNDYLNNMVGRIATEVRNQENDMGHQESVLNQLENYRESLSGVSLEEESMNLIKYQAVFNATAKVVKLGDELFQTILNIKP